MSRILVAGLPRSGTSWLAETIAAAPGVDYVYEPDNWDREPLAWVGARSLGRHPVLAPGVRADDYRLLWKLAFAGGWSCRRLSSDRIVLRCAASSVLPLPVRISLYRGAARIAARRTPSGRHQLVKTVFACHALEWIEHELEPTLVVVWRHPLNLVSSWREIGWLGNVLLGFDATAVDPRAPELPVRGRFKETAVWPPPAEESLARSAWILCAETVLLLETAERHPDWIIVGHEQQCLDPVRGFRGLFARLGIDWAGEMDQRLAVSNRPGSGYETKRRWADEPLRWKSRLTSDEQREILAVVQDFERVSPIAAAAWQASPAMAVDRAV